MSKVKRAQPDRCARLNGRAARFRIYSMPGEPEYIATMPPVDSGVVNVEFELDHAILPWIRTGEN